tara:strand:- start:89 stop:604 length:516 start_codon:yes stop_codon:yes gene_type:complete
MDMIEARIKEYKKTINELENKLNTTINIDEGLIKELELYIKELEIKNKGLKSDVLIYKIQYDNLKKDLTNKDDEIKSLMDELLEDGINHKMMDKLKKENEELKKDNKWLANRNKEIIKKKDDEIKEVRNSKIEFMTKAQEIIRELKKEIERLKKDELNHSYIPTSNINTAE